MKAIDYRAIYEKNKHDWFAMTEEPQKYEALLAGHYSDSNHFVYELLQNAEDEGANKVVVEYYNDQLVFYHNGKPFDENDVCGVSSMLMGTKNKDDASTIGRFGMGFKSVFKYTCRPEIYFDDDGFVIQSFLLPVQVRDGWNYEKAKKELYYLEKNKKVYPFVLSKHLTKIVIPFKKIDAKGKLVAVDGKDVLDKLNGLSGEILMFLTHIQDFYWINKESGEHAHITLNKDEKDVNLITCRVVGRSETEKGEITKYLKYKDVFDLPEMKNAEVSVAYKVNNQEKSINVVSNSPIWVYFPTRDDTALPFLIHGSFETAVSREKLMTPSDFNKALFERLGSLIANTMEDLGKRGLISQGFIRRVILAADKDEMDNETIPGLTEKISTAFKTKPLVPDSEGRNRMVADLRIPVPFSLVDLSCSNLWRDAFNDVGDFVAFNNEREAGFSEYFNWLLSLGMRCFTLKDFAQNLCDLSERKVVSDLDKKELKALYDFISEYKENDYENVGSYSRTIGYERMLQNCLKDAWKYLRKSPIILNAENCLVPAYKNDELQIYLSSLSKYRRILKSGLVSEHIAKSYYDLLSNEFNIAEFDNYQFVKEKVIQKYIQGKDGCIAFENPNDYNQEYLNDLLQIFSLFDEIEDDEVRDMLEKADIIRAIAADGSVYFVPPSDTYVEHSDEGIDLSIYYHSIDDDLYCIDMAYYEKLEIDAEKLKKLGLIVSPVDQGTRSGRGTGDYYWDALGEYCPNLSIDHLFENLYYIKDSINSELAKKKSAEMLKLLLSISGKLKGTVRKRIRNPYSVEESANLLNCWPLNSMNWLFGKDGELHSIQEISYYDLDDEIYKDIPYSKQACRILGFVENELDVKNETFERVLQLNRMDQKSMFQQLAKILGYNLDSLEESHKETFSENEDANASSDVFNPNVWISDEFPVHRVRDFGNLKTHVRQQFFFADPVTYVKVMRQIRSSKDSKSVRAYTVGMYQNESDVNICQMCKNPSKSVEAVEIANFEIEMPQLHLSLCPNCASVYKALRDKNKDLFKKEICSKLQELDEKKIKDNYEIQIFGKDSIYFTQTHIAEVKEILNLLNEYGVPKKTANIEIDIVQRKSETTKIEALSCIEYKAKKGDLVLRPSDGKKGTIVAVISSNILVDFNGMIKEYRMPLCFESGYLKIQSRST